MNVVCYIRRQESRKAARWVRYEVAVEEGTTVLNLLHAISCNEPGLAYTVHHCKTGVCAGCRMVINGKQRFACRSLVKASEIRLEPVPEVPVIKDLLVDFLATSREGAEQRRNS
jgi:succinate dehydrogenase/fumarate reductase-like Fe-S protein